MAEQGPVDERTAKERLEETLRVRAYSEEEIETFMQLIPELAQLERARANVDNMPQFADLLTFLKANPDAMQAYVEHCEDLAALMGDDPEASWPPEDQLGQPPTFFGAQNNT